MPGPVGWPSRPPCHAAQHRGAPTFVTDDGNHEQHASREVHVGASAEHVGLTREQIRATRLEDHTAGCWSESDSLLIQAVDELCASGRLGDDTLARFREAWTVEEQLELLALCGKTIRSALSRTPPSWSGNRSPPSFRVDARTGSQVAHRSSCRMSLSVSEAVSALTSIGRTCYALPGGSPWIDSTKRPKASRQAVKLG